MKKKLIYFSLIAFIFVIGMNSVYAGPTKFDLERITVCGFDNVPKNIPMLTSGLYNLAKFAVPIIIIVMGLVDFLSATAAADIDKMKKSKKKFINRLIAGVFIFLILAIVQFIFRKIDFDKNQKAGFFSCMNCILSNDCKSSSTTKQTYIPCNNRGQSTCTSAGNSDAYGHKCMLLQGQYCVDDCSSYTSRSCPSSYCQWIQKGSDPSNGECKQKANVNVLVPNINSSSSSSCSTKCNKMTGTAKERCLAECKDTNNTTAATVTTDTPTTSSSFANTKCSDCSKIKDETGRKTCLDNCKDDTPTTTTTTTTTQSSSSKCSTIKNNNACTNAGGCSWVNGTCVSSSSATETANKCTSIKNSNACTNAGGCSWINNICVPN